MLSKGLFIRMSLACVLCLYGIISAKTCEEWWSWFNSGGDIGDRSQDVYEISKECNNRESVEPLLELLKNDTSSKIRETAANGLGIIADGDSSIKKDKMVINALFDALKDKSMGVRLESANTLDMWDFADTSIVLTTLFDIARGVGKNNWFKDGCRSCYGGDTSNSKYYISSLRYKAIEQLSHIYLKKPDIVPCIKLLKELSSDQDKDLHALIIKEFHHFNIKDSLNTKQGKVK